MVQIRHEKIKASPKIRKLAKDLNIDLNEIEVNNETGRIEAADIEKYLANKIEKVNKAEKVRTAADEEFDNISKKIDYFKDKTKPSDKQEEKVVRYAKRRYQNVNHSEPEEIKVRLVNDNSASSVSIDNVDNERYESLEDADRIQVINRDTNKIKTPIEININGNDSVVVSTPANDRMEILSLGNDPDRFNTIDEEIVSKEFNDDDQIITVENNVVNQVVVQKEQNPIDLIDDIEDLVENDGEDSYNQHQGKKVIITLNDATNNSVLINDNDSKEVLDHEEAVSELVIETKTQKAATLGIEADLTLIYEMLESYSTITHKKVFHTILKAIAFALDKVEVESFTGSFDIYKFDDVLGYVGNKIDDINSLTVTQIERRMQSFKGDGNGVYSVTDFSGLGIDFYYPIRPVENVDIVINIMDKKVKVFVSATTECINSVQFIKFIKLLKSVINNPSLMLV